MDAESRLLSIADPSRPNAGRIYDYMLGGHHNFEVDRQAAETVVQIAPFMSKSLILIRWFLGEAVRRLINQGHDRFLDFASGLPTMEHIHEIAPPGTRVIYSDIDPVTVEYGREILGGNPNVRYVECDAGRPEDLLGSGVPEPMFGQERRLAIGFNGISYFLPDETLRHALRTLYDWAGGGSSLFLCDADADMSRVTDKIKTVFDIYSKIGQPIYIRPKERLFELAAPWRIEEPGPLPLDEWVDLGKVYTPEEQAEYGGTGFFGVIFRK
ncbi:MAG: SAM-dependent methyltransferase [Proteobacteria bacterium]|nr:SAM-dependent methyltransferase [Pseudomonadota bacterium]